jgi:Domain of unknown function DUF1828
MRSSSWRNKNMKISSVVLYSIDEKSVSELETALQQEDPGAYREQGAYFQNHSGQYYLVSQDDIGAEVRMLLESMEVDISGGIEITGTEEELQVYGNLLESEECYSCRLKDRLLLVPKPNALAAFVQWLQAGSSTQHVQDGFLCQGLWEIGTMFSTRVVGTAEEGYTEIETPYSLPDGDIIDLYFRREGETLLITDLGETLAWLRMQQSEPFLPETMQSQITDICSVLAIEQDRGMLCIHLPAQSQECAAGIVRLVQCVLRVADLSMLFSNQGA